jgi:hypothetical protein
MPHIGKWLRQVLDPRVFSFCAKMKHAFYERVRGGDHMPVSPLFGDKLPSVLPPPPAIPAGWTQLEYREYLNWRIGLQVVAMQLKDYLRGDKSRETLVQECLDRTRSQRTKFPIEITFTPLPLWTVLGELSPDVIKDILNSVPEDVQALIKIFEEVTEHQEALKSSAG